jgi:hypothetical protein
MMQTTMLKWKKDTLLVGVAILLLVITPLDETISMKKTPDGLKQ